MNRQTMRLEPEQVELLVQLVEAERGVPREQRQRFAVARSVGAPGVQLLHPGWKPLDRRVPEVDLETLASAGLLLPGYSPRGDSLYSVTPGGYDFYSEVMASQGEPEERVEARVRTYFESGPFRSRHPAAYKRWVDAEALLWAEDTDRNLTTVGHLCREALQEFASSLVAVTRATNVERDPAKTVARVRAVIEARRSSVGTAVTDFLSALLGYWGTVSDLAQRQEHGAQKEGAPLGVEDAARLVRQTLIVMHEVDNALV